MYQLIDLREKVTAELRALHADEAGQGVMEYAVFFLTMAALVVGAVTILGNGLTQMAEAAVQSMPGIGR